MMPSLNDVYSPDTGEHIATDNPAPWMLRAWVAAPTYDPAASGCFWRNGAWVIVPASIPTAADLLFTAKGSALDFIDSQAGTTRSKYITNVAGQSETYMSKATDAANYKAAGYPFSSLASYPWVQAEAKAINGAMPTAAQAQSAADGILAAQTSWIALGSSIEQGRRAGSVAVLASTNIAAVQAAQFAAIAAIAAM